jgi:uncharacterized RDD family membrane protein YckC
MSETPAGPGWYDDPDDASLLRYFDGVVWSSHTTPRTSPTAGTSTIGRAHDVPGAAPRTSWTAPGTRAPEQDEQGSGQGSWGQGRGGMPPAQGWGTAYGQAWQQPRKDVLPDGAVLAEWWRRLLARVADWFVVYVATLIVAFPWLGDAVRAFSDYWSATLAAAESGATPPDSAALQDALLSAALPITLISLVLSVLYEVVFLVWRGATPGKMLFGMVVRRTQRAGKLTTVDALRRQLITIGTSVVSLVPVVGILGTAVNILDPAWLLWDPRRQALHDKVADTVVVLRR